MTSLLVVFSDQSTLLAADNCCEKFHSVSTPIGQLSFLRAVLWLVLRNRCSFLLLLWPFCVNPFVRSAALVLPSPCLAPTLNLPLVTWQESSTIHEYAQLLQIATH
jgi:hypothetical protein